MSQIFYKIYFDKTVFPGGKLYEIDFTHSVLSLQLYTVPSNRYSLGVKPCMCIWLKPPQTFRSTTNMSIYLNSQIFVLSWVSLASMSCILTVAISFSFLYTTVRERTALLTTYTILNSVNPFTLLDIVAIKELINDGCFDGCISLNMAVLT